MSHATYTDIELIRCCGDEIRNGGPIYFIKPVRILNGYLNEGDIKYVLWINEKSVGLSWGNGKAEFIS